MLKFSPLLKTRLTELAADDSLDLSEVTDASCTAGYDNDGSSGPELIENGVRLGLAARDYLAELQRDGTADANTKVTIFHATVPGGESTAGLRYFVFGTDEEDALGRLYESVTEWRRAVTTDEPTE